MRCVPCRECTTHGRRLSRCTTGRRNGLAGAQRVLARPLRTRDGDRWLLSSILLEGFRPTDALRPVRRGNALEHGVSHARAVPAARRVATPATLDVGSKRRPNADSAPRVTRSQVILSGYFSDRPPERTRFRWTSGHAYLVGVGAPRKGVLCPTRARTLHEGAHAPFGVCTQLCI